VLRIQVFGSGIGDDIDDVDSGAYAPTPDRKVLSLWHYISTFLTRCAIV
jgi:hypothetical protein